MLDKLLQDHSTGNPTVLVIDHEPSLPTKVGTYPTWSALGASQGVQIHMDAPMIPVGEAAVRACINTRVASEDPRVWRRQWLTCLAEAAAPGGKGSVNSETLGKLGENVRGLFLVDTSPLPMPGPAEKGPLRVLFTDVLRALRDRRGQPGPFGLIVFTSSELVRASVPQNSDQLMSRYRQYAHPTAPWPPS